MNHAKDVHFKMKIKIGIVGFGSQGKRIYKILTKKKFVKILILRKSKTNKIGFTNNLKDFKDCELVFICSPNKTHFFYLKKFLNNKYIFCEKPPVTTIKQIDYLLKNDYGKTFYNYNMRYSKFCEFIKKNSNKYKVGNYLYGSIYFGHNIGLKSRFKNNWRFNKNYCKKGVFEVLAVHAIDLINFIFGKQKIVNKIFLNNSRFSKSVDTSLTTLIGKKKSITNIFVTYCSPLIFQINLIFENAVFEIDQNSMNFFYPGFKQDKKKFTVKPPLKQKILYNKIEDYNYSLKKSVNTFLNIYKNKKVLDKSYLLNSLYANKLIL